MCVVMAKYFPAHGWVICKNRDRNYTPEIVFNRYTDEDTGIERLMFEDMITKYCEGINSAGVSILSASLSVADDEKEVDKTTSKKTGDGVKIKKALLSSSAKGAAATAIKEKLTGFTFIADRDTCYLLEGCRQEGEYKHVIKQLKKDEGIARTNHGIWLPWAGYQSGKDKKEELSRISSESRRLIGQFIVDTAQDPEDMINGMAKLWVDNPQLNVMRTDTKTKKMRTTAQLMCIPDEQTLFVRPVASDINFDFWKLNKAGADTWVELLSNRELYRHTKENDAPPFNELVNHHAIHESLEEGWKDWAKAGVLGTALATGGVHAATQQTDVPPGHHAVVIDNKPIMMPDGTQMVVKDGVTDQQVVAYLQKNYPQALTKPVQSPAQTAVQPVQQKEQPRLHTRPPASAVAAVKEMMNTKMGKYIEKCAIQHGLEGDELFQFLAQTAHESDKYKKFQEDLDYNASRLMEVFPKIFDAKTAKKYAHHPKEIANRAYANKNGNGDEKSGDGWKYRGRGFMHLTGKDNYARAGKAIGQPLLQDPDLAAKPEVAAQVALWFWDNQVAPKLSNYADTAAATKPINKGLTGLQSRHNKFLGVKDVLSRKMPKSVTNEVFDSSYDYEHYDVKKLPSNRLKLAAHDKKMDNKELLTLVPGKAHLLADVSFITDSGVMYSVKLLRSRSDEGEGGVSVILENDDADDPYGISKTGDAIKIFSTVKKVLSEYLSTHPETEFITFTADRSEPSRVKLYNAFANQFQRVFPEYSFKNVRPEGKVIRYILAKPE